MFHAAGESSASGATPSAEVNDEGAMHREGRGVFVARCHAGCPPFLADLGVVARYVTQTYRGSRPESWENPGITRGESRENPGSGEGVR
jgi:hypothetical protein